MCNQYNEVCGQVCYLSTKTPFLLPGHPVRPPSLNDPCSLGWPGDLSLPTECEKSGTCHFWGQAFRSSVWTPCSLSPSTQSGAQWGQQSHVKGLGPCSPKWRRAITDQAYIKAQTKCFRPLDWDPQGQGSGLFHLHIPRTWHNSWQVVGTQY